MSRKTAISQLLKRSVPEDPDSSSFFLTGQGTHQTVVDSMHSLKHVSA